MKAYETVVVIDPSLDDSGVEKKLEKLTDIIKKHDGQIASIDRWGRRKLAYPINHRHEGTYICLQYFAQPQAPSELNKAILLDDNILRHLTIRGHIQTASPSPEPEAAPSQETESQPE